MNKRYKLMWQNYINGYDKTIKMDVTKVDKWM